MTVRHFLLDTDLSAAEQAEVLDRADAFKAARAADRTGGGDRPLTGRAVARFFEKPSPRPRVSFDVGVAELGGHPVLIDSLTSQLARGETLEDTGRVLSRFVDAVVMRT